MDQRKISILKSVVQASHKPAHLRAIHPDVLYVEPAYVPHTGKFLYRIIMKDGETIYGYAKMQSCGGPPYLSLYMVDAWDWLSMGGLYLLADEFDSDSLETENR